MATTKETMEVIAKGIYEKDKPNDNPAKTIVRVEVPDELAYIFERDIDSIRISRKKEDVEKELTALEEDEEYELTDAEELAEQITFEVAEKAGSDFVLLAEEAEPECIELVLELLRKRFFGSLTHVLRTLFLTAGWSDAVWRLDLLDNCDEYNEATDELFYDYFFSSEALTDYCAEHFSKRQDEEKGSSPSRKLN